MKHYYTVCLILFFVVTSSACKKYLDVTPDNTATLDYAFQNRNEAENYLFTCYSPLQKLADVLDNPGFTGSAEIVIPDPSLTSTPNLTGDAAAGFNILKGMQNSQSPAQNYWDGNTAAVSMWEAIRKCNIMLENIDKPVDLTIDEKTRWIAETKFLKAYYHYWMLRMYGPIPILRQDLPIDASTDEVRVKREPVDSVFNYIVQLLNESIAGLPTALLDASTEYGRITKPIALAVKAEVLATEASPLFNGNPDYATFKDQDGVQLFSPTYDPDKWDSAKVACKAAIDACEGIGARLYQFIKPGNIDNISDKLTEVLTLQNAVTEKSDLNPEVIWALNPYFNYQSYAAARLTSFAAAQYFTVHENFSVPISIAQLFYSNNGVPISEDKSWDYTNRYTVQNGDSLNEPYIRTGYATAKLNFNREPRYYADLGFDGGIWFGSGKTKEAEAMYVQATGTTGTAYAGPNNYFNMNVTGYWPKKLVNYQTTYYLSNNTDYTEVPFRLPVIRLADLYLLYAETINEADGPSNEALQYIDLVRRRAGLEDVKNAWTKYSRNPSKYSTRGGLRQIIHQERRIELCFEGRIGWDLRRWKETESVLSNPIQGWNWPQSTNPDSYYSVQTLFLPTFNTRDYLWPIPDNDLVINPKLVQNPGW